MIPVLLFFGLCFFGLGDCDQGITVTFQGVTEQAKTITLSYLEGSNQTINWSNIEPANQTSNEIIWHIPTNEENLEFYNCTKYEKVGWVNIYHNSGGNSLGSSSIQQCVPLSNEEMLIQQNSEILELLRNHISQQNNPSVMGDKKE